MNGETSLTIGIDLGGTNVEIGVVDRTGGVLRRASIATEAAQGVDHVIHRLVDAIDGLLREHGLSKRDIQAVGFGAAGPLSHTKGMIYSAPNLPGWKNVPLRQQFADAIGLPVVLENDANAAAFGEFIAGAGKDARSIVMLTLGTGIGGGIVLDGELLRGDLENAAEIGHMIVELEGRACPCGQRGCLERYASASAVAERLVEAVQAGDASSLSERIQAGDSITSKDVARAAAVGDVSATRIWDEACRYLAVAVINVQHMVNPEMVILGGGLSGAGDALLTPLRAHFERLKWSAASDFPRIELAALGADAGIIGAAALARSA
jgi:glucokinase